jgi:hypothetical protein
MRGWDTHIGDGDFYLPWLALVFLWKNLNPAVRIIMVLVPLSLLSMEQFNIADRMDFTGKIGGYLFGAAWTVMATDSRKMSPRRPVTHPEGDLSTGCWKN